MESGLLYESGKTYIYKIHWIRPFPEAESERSHFMVNDGIGSNTLNSSEYVYDYFLKDHLGNIRVVLTSEIIKTDYIARRL